MARSLCRLLTAAAVAWTGMVAGCGSGDPTPREPVSGRVTLNGQPIAEGQISFLPEDGDNVVAAPIENGSYRIRRAEGPSPGPHRVSIWSRVPSGRQIEADPLNPGELVDEYVETVPERYNVKSELTVTVEQGGSNTFDFDLTGDPPPPGNPRS
jgi:hypothetical protein